MAGALLWGWDATNKVWIPLQVDANGYVKVDMSNINLDDLADVSVAAPTDGDFFYWDDAASLWKPRKVNFLELSDTPAAYTGQAGKLPKVNAGEDALEFAARGWELLDDHYFDAIATSYTISGLDGNLDKIYMLFVFLVRNPASNYGLVMRPNNDSAGGNYRQQTIGAYGTTVEASHYIGAGLTGISVAFVMADCDVSWNAAQYLYAPTGHYRQCHGFRHYDYSATVGSPKWDSRLTTWRNSADNITSLVFVSEVANGFGIGSRITLFRMAR